MTTQLRIFPNLLFPSVCVHFYKISSLKESWTIKVQQEICQRCVSSARLAVSTDRPLAVRVFIRLPSSTEGLPFPLRHSRPALLTRCLTVFGDNYGLCQCNARHLTGRWVNVHDIKHFFFFCFSPSPYSQWITASPPTRAERAVGSGSTLSSERARSWTRTRRHMFKKKLPSILDSTHELQFDKIKSFCLIYLASCWFVQSFFSFSLGIIE